MLGVRASPPLPLKYSFQLIIKYLYTHTPFYII
nr:MAG TPA: hypothetical protein [Caudoviricetes sp.]DAJ68624.1 MAG TPA: hypothetical protein [Caudoviricetes sp.]